MDAELIEEYSLGDMIACYERDPKDGRTGFFLLPASMREVDTAEKNMEMEPLVQLKLTGDIYGASYAAGKTLRNSETVRNLAFKEQKQEEADGCLLIHTVLTDPRGYEVTHHLRWKKDTSYVMISCSFENQSEKEVSLEMMESFSLGGLSPYVEGDGYASLYLHRIRSDWSQEGEHEVRPVEDFLLVPAWGTHCVRNERFGQLGSMPVNEFFPFAAIEDRENHLFWGAQLMARSSWQMEIYRKDDGLALSGGLADRDFGQWEKRIKPGETFTTPEAIVSTAQTASFDEFCARLTAQQLESFYAGPDCEKELPVLFNEYCTTWGCPSHENIVGILDKIKDKGFSYFVIDAGWYKKDGISWEDTMGDYLVSKSLFPGGMEETTRAIREAGMVPGLWFEIENVGRAADAYQMEEHLLHRDGEVLTTYARRFWDMRDPWVQDYLADKVIGTLKQYGFGYMKIDCNETIGAGCDGAESPGEGLRQDMEASGAFLDRVKEEIPGIVLEDCASGGHRLEPAWLDQMSMASFSDAHELPEIPLIAAHQQRVVHPVKNQIWAVIRKDDSLKRIAWTMANTFLGRMCLSGDVEELSEAQWKMIEDGIAFYRKIVPVIREGVSYLFGPEQLSFRHPKGWQAVLRVGKEGEAYVLFSTFAGELPEEIRIPLPQGCPSTILECYSDEKPDVSVSEGALIYRPSADFRAVAVRLGA